MGFIALDLNASNLISTKIWLGDKFSVGIDVSSWIGTVVINSFDLPSVVDLKNQTNIFISSMYVWGAQNKVQSN